MMVAKMPLLLDKKLKNGGIYEFAARSSLTSVQ
jgi:hypothetical protein